MSQYKAHRSNVKAYFTFQNTCTLIFLFKIQFLSPTNFVIFLENVPTRDWTSPVLNSPLMHIEGFLLALTTANDDGRVVTTKQSKWKNFLFPLQ